MRKLKKRTKKLIRIISMGMIIIGLSGLLITVHNMAVKHIEKQDSFIRDRMVMLTSAKGGACSGIQVRTASGKPVILTAAHCAALLDSKKHMFAIDEQGNKHDIEFIAEDMHSDLMILSSFNEHSIQIADSIKRHEKVHAITHGAAHDSYRMDGELLEIGESIAGLFYIDSPADTKLCKSKPKYQIVAAMFGEICALVNQQQYTTVVVVGGSSGGPLLNEAGHLVGIVSATDGNFSTFVTLDDIHIFLANF